jgi:hypothetical protein
LVRLGHHHQNEARAIRVQRQTRMTRNFCLKY